MKISAIIPLYNAGEYIADCLESLVQQELQPVEIICVDDCSTDHGLALVIEYEKKYPGLVKFIRLEKNAGAPFARNTGLKLATGDYIQFLDADDYLLPQKLSAQVKLIGEQKEQPDFIAAGYFRISTAGNKNEIQVNDGNAWMSLINGKLGCTCSNLWKRQSVLDVNGFDEKLKSSQEYGLMFALLKRDARIIYDRKPLTIVRDRPPGMSISRKDPPKNWEQYILLRGETIQYLESANLISPDEKAHYFQSLFEAIRILYHFSPEKSVELFRKYIPSSFVPKVSGTITAAYCKAYRILGFSAAEKLKSLSRIFRKKRKE